MGKQKPAAAGQLTRRDGSRPAAAASVPQRLLADLRKLIDDSRQTVARTVNTAPAWLYWNIGKRIREDVLEQKRAAYGEEILYTLCRELSWSHFRRLIYLDEPLKRDFYAEMCRIERWSVRTLQKKINGMMFERTALSRKPDELARQELAALREEDRLTPDRVFRDPYWK